MAVWCFLLLDILAVTVVGVHAQAGTQGFISIDCGTPSGYNYPDGVTGIPYVSDKQFIDTGTNYNISVSYVTNSLAQQLLTVRSFPTGTRNCYTLKPVTRGSKYLVRATFLYGNYDGLFLRQANSRQLLLFDLYWGVDLWDTINITNASSPYVSEVMAVALADFVSVCLVNTGSGTPFVSSLELRPLKSTIYQAANASQSLVLHFRLNVGPTTNDVVRYPDDPYDRIWDPWNALWDNISTNSTVRIYAADAFDPPSAVLQTAATPASGTGWWMGFYWYPRSRDPLPEYYSIMYFSELKNLTGNASRAFDVILDGDVVYHSYSPPYLVSGALYDGKPRSKELYNYTLNATTNSTLPPILNALEAYIRLPVSDLATDAGDVDAIMAIKKKYQLQRNWMGDPCSPRVYAWDGLNCSYNSKPPRIVTIDLSSSGLTGVISTSFGLLTATKYLDLSYNNLTGAVPDFLADLSSLQVLNLTGNNFCGQIPDALKKKSDSGLLILRTNLNGNNNLCGCCKKKKSTAPIIVALSVAVAVLLLLFVVVFIVLRRRSKLRGLATSSRPRNENYSEKKDLVDHQLPPESRQFTYMQLANVTNNFVRVVGKGGFGIVYHGVLENGTEVAVKMHSQSSSQGSKEFLAEAQNLARVHHRNLVPLVGYCKDGNYLALVYEYMPQGSLQERLRGRSGLARALSWRQRLQIALETAQGLEYLHKGCKPPIIHRDVKTSNILLGEQLEAKISDFGLSKAFHSDTQTHVSTVMAVGTPGYVDPMSDNWYQLNEKSDVYSFGVILLELITGQPPLLPGPLKTHIVQRVAPELARGNIDDVVDVRLQRQYDSNSIWKVMDLAMKCTAPVSAQRPTMSDVVMQLKESLVLETAHERNENMENEGFDFSQNSTFERANAGELSVAAPSAR